MKKDLCVRCTTNHEGEEDDKNKILASQRKRWQGSQSRTNHEKYDKEISYTYISE